LKYHHRKLPDNSTLLAGRVPPDGVGFKSERLQIWYNNSQAGWVDPVPHRHLESDECFIVLKGSLLVEVESEPIIVGEREFICFPTGVFHAIIEVYPPIETLMVRAPSAEDKVYREEGEAIG
jgi:mannose-6-phosphate isomerase-like protein (cupin superfamily)